MKLKNKKTGEIVEGTDILALMATGDDLSLPVYRSLAELNAKWEDVPEEPERKHWYMTSWGEVWQYGDDDSLHKEWRKIIGNDFETKEEAEKALEKLKALVEAKNDGLKIKGYYYNHEDLVILADIGKCNKLTLNTLFGKEIDG